MEGKYYSRREEERMEAGSSSYAWEELHRQREVSRPTAEEVEETRRREDMIERVGHPISLPRSEPTTERRIHRLKVDGDVFDALKKVGMHMPGRPSPSKVVSNWAKQVLKYGCVLDVPGFSSMESEDSIVLKRLRQRVEDQEMQLQAQREMLIQFENYVGNLLEDIRLMNRSLRGSNHWKSSCH